MTLTIFVTLIFTNQNTNTMKNFKKIIVLALAVFTICIAQAETPDTQRNVEGKTPWQIMQVTLYNHFVDTTALSVVSPIEAQLKSEIIPDLAKAYHVSQPVDLSQASTLGEVICVFMRQKYAGRSGEIYDYYKYRYSPRQIYGHYLERYPNSPYAEEMRLKGECLDLYYALNESEENHSWVLTYGSYSYCPFEGFTAIATINNTNLDYYSYLLSVEDWEDDYEIQGLVSPYSESGNSLLCFGNVGRYEPITVLLQGPATIRVLLEPGKYEWVKVENGNYDMTVICNEDKDWAEQVEEKISVEDAIYGMCWYSSFGYVNRWTDYSYSGNLDGRAEKEYISDLVAMVKDELTKLAALDYDISRHILMNFVDQVFSDSKSDAESLHEDLKDDEYLINIIDMLYGVFDDLMKEQEEDEVPFKTHDI